MEFEVLGSKRAAKCIKKPESILYPTDLCLKEIFMVKFASALGIGPLFHNDYLYDILVLKTHYEYLMERCEIPSIHNKVNR